MVYLEMKLLCKQVFHCDLLYKDGVPVLPGSEARHPETPPFFELPRLVTLSRIPSFTGNYEHLDIKYLATTNPNIIIVAAARVVSYEYGQARSRRCWSRYPGGATLLEATLPLLCQLMVICNV